MDFSITDEQEEVRDLARKILTDLAKSGHLRAIEESDDGIDRVLWAELAKADLLGVGLPESAGGGELGFTTLCLFLQEVGRAVHRVHVHPFCIRRDSVG